MVMIWIPGNFIFIGYTNPKIKVSLTVFISVEKNFYLWVTLTLKNGCFYHS